MDSNPMYQLVLNMKKSLFDEGYLNSQFTELEKLQDLDNPNFVEDVVVMFFRESGKVFATFDAALDEAPRDFRKLEKFGAKFKGSSSSIGAPKLTMECEQLREACRRENVEECKAAVKRIKEQHSALRAKLESYFQLARQVGPPEMAQRPKQ